MWIPTEKAIEAIALVIPTANKGLLTIVQLGSSHKGIVQYAARRCPVLLILPAHSLGLGSAEIVGFEKMTRPCLFRVALYLVVVTSNPSLFAASFRHVSHDQV